MPGTEVLVLAELPLSKEREAGAVRMAFIRNQLDLPNKVSISFESTLSVFLTDFMPLLTDLPFLL